MILSRSSKATKAGVLGSLFVSKIFIHSRECYVIIPLLKSCAKGLLFWIVERQRDCENSFEVRLTSSRTRQRDRQPGATWGVYAIDSMDALACANAHCPRLRAETRGEWHSLPMCQPSTRKLSVISRYCFVCVKCTVAAKR